MATLYNKSVKDTYPDLLTVLGSVQGEGITNTYKPIYDGDGTSSHMFLSNLGTQFTGLTTIGGSLALTEQSTSMLSTTPSKGQVAFINNNLYIGQE